MEKEFNLSFTDIFKNDGWYKGQMFAEGTFIHIEQGVLSLKYFSKETDTFAKDLDIVISKNLVNMKFRNILNKGQLFSK